MARDFPGGANSDRIVVSNYSAINTLTAYSISVWMLIDTYDATFRRIADKTTNGTIGGGTFALYAAVSGSNVIQFDDYLWGTSPGTWTIPAPSAGSWTHLLVTYNGAATTNDPVMYLNNVSQTVTEGTAPSGTRAGSETSNLFIGNRDVTNDRCLDGKVAELAVWNRVIDATERGLLARRNSANIVSSGLVGYWRLLGNSPEENRVAGGNNGTVTGTSTFTHPPINAISEGVWIRA